MQEEFISKQITVYKNSKTLLEFVDKLKAASIGNYAHIHADGEKSADGKNMTSLIGILMKDYSNGTGDNAVTVTCNVSPEEIKYYYSKVKNGVLSFEDTQEKIFGEPDKNGYSSVTKFRIIRAAKDSKGNVRRLPWYVEVENGKAKAAKNANGGIYIAPKSYVPGGKVFVNMSDKDMFSRLARVNTFIEGWEAGIAPVLIGNAAKRFAEQRKKQSTSTTGNKKAA